MLQSPCSCPSHEQRDQKLFDQIADDYCRKDLLPASRLARKLRLHQTLQTVPAYPNARMLEVGCGTGFAAKYLQGRFATYFGVDYSENLIKYARAHNAGPGIEFEMTNIKDFGLGREFDMIFAIGVLHHLDDLDSALSHMVGLLKPGGWLLANEPHSGNPVVSLARRFRKKLDPQYSEDQAEMTAAHLLAAYEAAGLRSVRVIPQGLFSTLFAEVPMKLQCLAVPLAATACFVDSILEGTFGRLLRSVTWNVIAIGRRPVDAS